MLKEDEQLSGHFQEIALREGHDTERHLVGVRDRMPGPPPHNFKSFSFRRIRLGWLSAYNSPNPCALFLFCIVYWAPEHGTHYAQTIRCTDSMYSLACNVGTIIIPLLQMLKLRLKDLKILARVMQQVSSWAEIASMSTWRTKPCPGRWFCLFSLFCTFQKNDFYAFPFFVAVFL